MQSTLMLEMLFKNDKISGWAYRYCMSNKEFENKKMEDIIFNYARNYYIARYRLRRMDEFLEKEVEDNKRKLKERMHDFRSI